MCDRLDSVEDFEVRLLAKRPMAGRDALLRCTLPPILVFGSREKDRGGYVSYGGGSCRLSAARTNRWDGNGFWFPTASRMEVGWSTPLYSSLPKHFSPLS